MSQNNTTELLGVDFGPFLLRDKEAVDFAHKIFDDSQRLKLYDRYIKVVLLENLSKEVADFEVCEILETRKSKKLVCNFYNLTTQGNEVLTDFLKSKNFELKGVAMSDVDMKPTIVKVVFGAIA